MGYFVQAQWTATQIIKFGAMKASNQKVEIMDHIREWKGIDPFECDSVELEPNVTIEALTFAASKGFKEYLELGTNWPPHMLPSSDLEPEEGGDDTALSPLAVQTARHAFLQQDRRGITPLHVVGCLDHCGEEGCGSAAIKPKARGGGRKTTARDFCGRRRVDAKLPSSNSAMSNRGVVAGLLIQQGSDLFSQATKGLLTPLHCQCFYGHIDVVKVIVENTPLSSRARLLRMEDSRGNLPLHVACMRGNWQV